MSYGLPMGLALASGVNTYLPLFVMTLFARFSGMVHVAPRFQWLISDEALVVLGVLCVCEILAQKFPVADNVWDFSHTLLRPVAGALAAGATLNAEGVPGLILTMLAGGTLATAAHSAKSGLRLVSTSKSFGIANPILSLGEDAAVVGGTLLSVLAPWLMLGLVLIVAVVFALVGPWLVRTLWFDLRIVAAWFKWLAGRIFHAPLPTTLRESLLDLPPTRLRTLSARLDPGEELLGALAGWKRSRGPRRCWLLIAPRRLMLVERRVLRKHKAFVVAYRDLVAVRERNLGPYVKLDFLDSRHQSFTLHLPKTQSAFAQMAAEKIRKLSNLSDPDRTPPLTKSDFASVTP
jgi:hypothetical protein